MSDDDDRTQEIPRDGDRFAGSDDGTGRDGTARLPQGGPAPSPDRPEGTEVLDRRQPAASQSGPSGQPRPQQTVPRPGPQQSGGYPPPGGGYRPSPSAGAAPADSGYGRAQQAYAGAPMLPTDRGSGGFPAAIVGAVVATLVAVASAFGGYQILRNHSSIDPEQVPGFVTYRMNMLVWPFDGGNSDLTMAFVVGGLIVLVVTALLMMAATMSTRAGNGGFAVFLAAWMATVIAGGVARPVAGAIAGHRPSPAGAWQTDIGIGVEWGVLFGWIAALVLVILHTMRRKPAMR